MGATDPFLMHLFHTPEIEGEFIALPAEEAHHALSVLRMKVGDKVGLLNGKGVRVEADIVELDRKRCITKAIHRETHPPERNARIHMAVALTKQIDRFEWFLEKAVEVGVDRITPLVAERSERKTMRMDRLQKVMVAAMKQSQRLWLPVLDEAVPLKELLRQELPPQRYFGWCEGEHRALMEVYTTTTDVIVVIGPEGDLSPDEAAILKQHDLEAVSLGKARLRTETAALAACTWMSLLQQR